LKNAGNQTVSTILVRTKKTKQKTDIFRNIYFYVPQNKMSYMFGKT